jgi:protein-tyrosine phosphatase
MKVLMVCLGNICRSPVAEAIFREKAKNLDIEVEVDSCGTSNYHIGQAPDERAQESARNNGLDISDLRARQFSIADFDYYDRIYVMDESNLRNVLKLTSDQNHHSKVKLILNELSPGANMEVPDPYFGGDEGFQRVFDLLDEACDKILEPLHE